MSIGTRPLPSGSWYRNGMGSLTKSVVHPVTLGKAFVLPFVQVIGGYAVLLAALYLLIGHDPSAPVGNLVADSVEVSLPLAGRLMAVWVFYCVFYLLLGLYDQDRWVIALFLVRITEVWERRGFFPWLGHFLPLGLIPFLLLVCLQPRQLPVWLAVGWRAGDSVQLE